MLKLITTVLISGFLTGCASIPDVTYSYYPAKWNTVVTVTQTVGCNAAKTRRVVLNFPTVTTTYTSNLDKPFQVKIKGLERTSADSDMTMTFTDDGRLKSINQSTTGEGEAIIKSAVSLATAAVSMTTSMVTEGTIKECAIIDAWGGNKPVTLTYKATIDSAVIGKSVDIEAASESKDLYGLLHSMLPKLKLKVSNVIESQSGPSYDVPSAESSEVVLLELQKIGSIDVIISSDGDRIGNARIVIPESDTYKLPIPKAALFGKQTFSVILSEAGAVTSIGYGKNVGTIGALNALGTIASTQTMAAKAADLKAQADLIAQQQRVVLCETKPDQCK
jgi:hypothetical protein